MSKIRQHEEKRINITGRISIFKVVLFLIPIFSLILTFSTSLPDKLVGDMPYAVLAEGEDDDSENSKYEPDESGFYYYNGDVDTVTGEPVDAVEKDEKTTNTTVIKDGSTYDSNTSLFIYKVTNGSLGVSVCNGMVVTDTVRFSSSGDVNVAIYHNGKKYDGIPMSVSEPGTYVVLTWDNESEEQVMSFQIVSTTTGMLSQYILPNGFTLMNVKVNGVESRKGYGSVDMSEEGYYEIIYKCNATGVDYVLYVTIDHTPPSVTFEGLDSKDRANGPVTLKGLTEDDTVYIKFNDDSDASLNYNNQLTQSGRYSVTVADAAGNYITRDFVIMIYLNVKGVFFFSLLVVLIIGVVVALYISRKRLRVR